MNYRSHAALVLLAHAANEAFRTARFDPDGANRDPLSPRASVLFDAPLGSMPMRIWVGDWRFDECRIVAAAWPTVDVDQWIEGGWLTKDLVGEVVVSGRLERGAKLHFTNRLDPIIFVRRSRAAAMQALPVPSEASDPLGLYPRFLSYAAAA